MPESDNAIHGANLLLKALKQCLEQLQSQLPLMGIGLVWRLTHRVIPYVHFRSLNGLFEMRFEDIKPGLRVQITSKTFQGGRLFLKTATILTKYEEMTGAPHIRFVLEDGSGEICHSIQPEDLDFE